ncbi:MAG: DNA photolyase [Syntrophobacterales bacterium]|nr:DNA photolyase [Syntrophobacterales bacterium]
MATDIDPFDDVFVEESVRESPIVRELRKNLPEARFYCLSSEPCYRNSLSEDFSKKLYVIRFKGRFLRSCPATRFYHCCGYTILHFGEHCTVGCTYCILQAYLNQPYIKIFGNLEEMLSEVKGVLLQYPQVLFRVGTGEFTDSLLLDPWAGYSSHFVPLFATIPNAVLELKTKTAFVDRLKDLPHGGHTIVSWSLNAPSIMTQEEANAAPFELRLECARRCLEWGYFLSFHFDPIFFFPGWEKEYALVVRELFETIPPRKIVYISLGAFRFMPELKGRILEKNPTWKFASGEFVPCPDGKRRYFVDIRVGLYKFLLEAIRSYAPDICVYLCMESGSVWKRVFGYSPDEVGGLPRILDDAVRKTMKVGMNCLNSAASLFLRKPQPYSSI